MVELYCGDGKGKTTAAVGMAVRAAGNGIPVAFFQFMKDGSSGEMKLLGKLPGVTTYYPERFYGFYNVMNEQQKEEMKIQYAKLLAIAAGLVRERHKTNVKEISRVIILDEIIHACNKELVAEERLLKLLEECPDNIEIILTGRNPSEKLLKKADYISEMKKHRHPFDRGVRARKGIEE